MSNIYRQLESGRELWLPRSGRSCLVMALQGAGKQGEVYRALIDGETFALKYFYPAWFTAAAAALADQYRNIERLIAVGRPCGSFLWPIEIAIDKQSSATFGYVMDWLEPRFVGLERLIDVHDQLEPSCRILATTAYALARSYHFLHSRGLCYRDVSTGNFNFEPTSGDVRIFDNDNVGTNGQFHPMDGTPAFMAPEIAQTHSPDSLSDLHSLAIVLFWLLCRDDPFIGRATAGAQVCFGGAGDEKVYGIDGVFVFHPRNAANRPQQGENSLVWKKWLTLPSFVRKLFVRAFTTGLADREARVRLGEWSDAMIALRDLACRCPRCGAGGYYDPDNALQCWQCRAFVDPTWGLLLPRGHTVVLEAGAKLFPHHIQPGAEYDFGRVIAETVVVEGENGLRNQGASAWRVDLGNGQPLSVPPGRGLRLRQGATINFGFVTGRVCRF